VSTFFERVPYEQAQQLEQLSRLAFELREHRKALLQPYGVDDEAALLARLVAGELEGPAAYDHYLAARVLEATRLTVRQQMGAPDVQDELPVLQHLLIREALERAFGARWGAPTELCQDALNLTLDNGVQIEMRVLDLDALAITWRWGDAQMRLDTAPRPQAPSPSGRHFIDAMGELRADPLAPADTAVEYVHAVVMAVLDDPTLQRL
jgi:hypothetical protein